MADSSAAPETTTAPTGLVNGIKDFRTDHGGATAVIEYVGRRGARIVLVGADGAWGDQFAPATDVARVACQLAGVNISTSWERDVADRMHGEPKRWRSMKRYVFAR